MRPECRRSCLAGKRKALTRPVFVLSVPIGSWHPVLPSAVSSILAQRETVRVAVLNASSDPRVDAALEPLNPLIAYRHDGPDDGQASAIRDGWSRVDGDICGWLNADDFLYPGALTKAADSLIANPSASVVTGQTSLFDGDMTYLGAHPAVETPGPSLLRGNTISQPSTFVRRSALDDIGGLDASLHYTMDWDLWARLYAAGKLFEALPDVLSGVVVAQTTKTSQFDLRRARELYAISRRYGGHFVALKSLSGFLQYHLAERLRPSSGNRRVRTPPPQSAAHAHLIAGRAFSEAARISLARYDEPTSSLAIEGAGTVQLSGTGIEEQTLSLPATTSIRIAQGQVLSMTLQPVSGEARVDHIRLH